MHLIADRGVTESERPATGRGRIPDWQNLRMFLELARHKSFRAAADRSAMSANAIRRHIEELENQFGAKLFVRHVNGVTLTEEGDRILAAVEKMEIASFEIVRAREEKQSKIAGQVTLGATEAFGTFWLAPRLVEFQRSYPLLVVDLQCAMRSADVLRLEAEAAIQVTKPTSLDCKVVKLGRVHSIPSASPSYLKTYGTPKSPESLKNHRVALQFAEQIPTQEVYDKLWPGMPQDGFVAFRTNNSSALLWSIVKGAGIGWVPTYIHAMGPKVVPINIGLVFSFDIWLTYHSDAARIPRVRRLIDWVMESFDTKHYPWFRDDFIHPDELRHHYKGPPLVNLFEGVENAGQF